MNLIRSLTFCIGKYHKPAYWLSKNHSTPASVMITEESTAVTTRPSNLWSSYGPHL